MSSKASDVEVEPTRGRDVYCPLGPPAYKAGLFRRSRVTGAGFIQGKITWKLSDTWSRCVLPVRPTRVQSRPIPTVSCDRSRPLQGKNHVEVELTRGRDVYCPLGLPGFKAGLF